MDSFAIDVVGVSGLPPGPFSRVQVTPDVRARPSSLGYFNRTILVVSSKPSASIRQK